MGSHQVLSCSLESGWDKKIILELHLMFFNIVTSKKKIANANTDPSMGMDVYRMAEFFKQNMRYVHTNLRFLCRTGNN